MEHNLYIEFLGYLGAIINTVSGVPQIIRTYKTKDVYSFSCSFIFSWALGCGLLLIYSFLTIYTLPVIINYSLNTAIPVVLLIMYVIYRKK